MFKNIIKVPGPSLCPLFDFALQARCADWFRGQDENIQIVSSWPDITLSTILIFKDQALAVGQVNAQGVGWGVGEGKMTFSSPWSYKESYKLQELNSTVWLMGKPKAQKGRVIFPRTQSKQAALPNGEDAGLKFGARKSRSESCLLYLLVVSTGHVWSLRLSFYVCKMEMERSPSSQVSENLHTCSIKDDFFFLLVETSQDQNANIQIPSPSLFLWHCFPFPHPWDDHHTLTSHTGHLGYVWVEGYQPARNTCEFIFPSGWYESKLYLLITQRTITTKNTKTLR